MINSAKTSVAFFLLMLLTFSVGAISNSENPNSESTPSIRSQTIDAVSEASRVVQEEAQNRFNQKREELRRQYAMRNCEEYEERADRIKCRFILGEEYRAPEGIVPEACRLSENQDRCKALYAATRTCYTLENRAKDACFKRALGIRKQLADEIPMERNQKAREYVVTLLYDLEERIEKAAESGKIDPEVGAEMIDKIVEIKGKILNGVNREEIRADIQVLKEMWRSALSDFENE